MDIIELKRLYGILKAQCREIGLVNLLAGFSLYLDAEADLYDKQASEANEVLFKSLYRKEFEKLSLMKSDIDTCINALVSKRNEE